MGIICSWIPVWTGARLESGAIVMSG